MLDALFVENSQKCQMPQPPSYPPAVLKISNSSAVPLLACILIPSYVHLLQMKRLLFLFSDRGDLLLASCAQDTFIRIWRVSSDNKVQEAEPENLCDKMPELKLTSNIFSVADKGVITNTYFNNLTQYTVYMYSVCL